MGVQFLLGYAMGEGVAARTVARAASIPSLSSVSVGDIEDLSARIDRLVLLSAAMWSILEDSGATEEELIARLHQIDAEDGVDDGKITPKPIQCTNCDTLVPAGLPACQYCGEPVRSGDSVDPFHTV